MIMFRTASLLFVVHTVSLLFLPLSSRSQTSGATSECTPSCGNIKISSPFRLQGDPGHCGNKSYELSCEADGTGQSHQAILYLYEGKYYVQAINYNNYTIRLVDAGVHKTKGNHFSNPVYLLTDSNFSYFDPYSLSYSYFALPDASYAYEKYLTVPLIFLSCPNQMNYSDLFVETAPCIKNTGIHSSSDSSPSTVYSYFMLGRLNDVGYPEDLSPDDLGLSCKITLMALVSPPPTPTPTDKYSKSCQGIYKQLAYGFQLSWLNYGCANKKCGPLESCALNSNSAVECLAYSGSQKDVLWMPSWISVFFSSSFRASMAVEEILFWISFLEVICGFVFFVFCTKHFGCSIGTVTGTPYRIWLENVSFKFLQLRGGAVVCGVFS